jgi:outer membrane protein assembly factor BamB
MYLYHFNNQKLNPVKTLQYFIPVLLLISCSAEEVIHEWRGSGRHGIFNESGLLKKWPEAGPAEIWAIEDLGNGNGSPSFADDRFYISGEKDARAILYCFSLDAKKIWETDLGPEWVKSYRGSRAAPTIAGDLLYYETGTGNLFCVERENGKIVWSKDFEKDAEGVPTFHGMTEAPVIDGDKVFWNPGGKRINVAALNRFSGELIWTSAGKGERSAYNQGNLIRLPSGNIFVTFSAYNLMGFNAETGELLWSQLQDNLPPEKRTFGMGDTHTNNIIYSDGSIYYQAGDGNCGVKLRLSDDGKTITEEWRNKRFDGYMGGIIKIDGHIYGTGTGSPMLYSVDAANGKMTDSLRIGSGALISADNMLYYYSQRGDLHLISYYNGKMKEISSFHISKGTQQHFSHPVIYQGVLYQRHGQVLMAYDIRAGK